MLRARWTGGKTGVALAGVRRGEEGRQSRRPVWSQTGKGPKPWEERPPIRRAPWPEHAAARTSKGSMCLLHGGPALLLPAPSHARRAPQLPPLGCAVCRGSSPQRPWQPACWGTAWVRKDLRRLEKVGRRRACIVPARCQPQSPTGSRRHVADVREDKGRHSPHQPPLIDGLCPRGQRAGGQGRSPLTFTFRPPTFQPPSSAPPPTHSHPRPATLSCRPTGGWGASRGDGVCRSACTLLFYCVLLFSKVSCFEVSSLQCRGPRNVITQSAPREPPD